MATWSVSAGSICRRWCGPSIGGVDAEDWAAEVEGRVVSGDLAPIRVHAVPDRMLKALPMDLASRFRLE